MTDKAVERLKAKLEVANAALQRAIEKAEWQARTNRELNDLLAENYRLKNAMQRTIDENLHLADGDVCTLIHLKRALATQRPSSAVTQSGIGCNALLGRDPTPRRT